MTGRARRHWRRAAAAALAAAALTAMHAPAAAERVLVYAAGSLTGAVEEILTHCRAEGRDAIAVSFAASGVLARQIEQGAAAHIYLSANPDWMAYLDDLHLLVDGSRQRFAGNTLVMVTPGSADTAVPQPVGFTTPAAALASLPGDARLAMGDPAYVPAGAYARAALDAFGLWAAVEGRVAAVPTVRAALALVETGAAPLGIVFATDAQGSRRVQVVGVFPEDSHPPIVYEIARVAGAPGDPAAARRVFDCLTGPAAAAVLDRFGFRPPPAAAPGPR